MSNRNGSDGLTANRAKRPPGGPGILTVFRGLSSVALPSPIPFHRHAVVVEADGAPEGPAGPVVHEDVEADAGCARPRVFAKPHDRLPSDSRSSSTGHDEQLPQVDMIAFLAEQGVTDGFAILLDEDRFIVAFEPAAHARFEFADGHRVAMPLVADELGVHPRQQRGVFGTGRPIAQVDWHRHSAGGGLMIRSADFSPHVLSLRMQVRTRDSEGRYCPGVALVAIAISACSGFPAVLVTRNWMLGMSAAAVISGAVTTISNCS